MRDAPQPKTPGGDCMIALPIESELMRREAFRCTQAAHVILLSRRLKVNHVCPNFSSIIFCRDRASYLDIR